MEEIQLLETKIEETEDQLDRLRNESSSAPDDFALSLSARSLEGQLEQLQNELRLAKEAREREVVDFRFIGDDVKLGSMPLHLAGEFLSRISEAIYEASYYVRHGRPHRRGRIPADIVSQLDLRLSDIAVGSSRLIISGALSPDLFGNSLLESSLHGTMAVLNAQTEDEVAEAVSDVGLSAAKKLTKFLGELQTNDLEVEVTWESPESETLKWEGKKRRIRDLERHLQRINYSSSKKWLRSATIVSMSIRGYVELRDAAGATHRYDYPHNIYSTVRQFHIGDVVDAEIEVNMYVYEATGAAKERRRVLTMRDPDKFKGIPENQF